MHSVYSEVISDVRQLVLASRQPTPASAAAPGVVSSGVE